MKYRAIYLWLFAAFGFSFIAEDARLAGHWPLAMLLSGVGIVSLLCGCHLLFVRKRILKEKNDATKRIDQ